MKEIEGNQVMFTVLELGGMDLQKYFDKIIRDEEGYVEEEEGYVEERTHEDFLVKVFRGAAKALTQFHKYGIHGDIKLENFIVSLGKIYDENVIECKLIDFNTSVLKGQYSLKNMKIFAKKNKAPEIVKSGKVFFIFIFFFRIKHMYIYVHKNYICTAVLLQ
ncbi:unnamed protein product [Meloidogyne enterolobii]|uniref:Uncharacterized protein n=1 Tax=Meloidogyne enterolobii TaxID=390850 RepID=A0ACB0XUP6_MELEN